MAVVILDKNMNSEVRFPADNVYERILYNTFNAVKTYDMKTGEDIPSIPQFLSSKFTTMEVVTDSGVEIPLTNEYGTVLAVSSHIDDINEKISYSIDIGK